MNPDENVTLVTRNTRAAIFEVLAYAALVYCVTHPDTIEAAAGKVSNLRDWAYHRISVWQTRVAIQSLPETDEHA